MLESAITATFRKPRVFWGSRDGQLMLSWQLVMRRNDPTTRTCSIAGRNQGGKGSVRYIRQMQVSACLLWYTDNSLMDQAEYPSIKI
jgi:hypothetical protein